MFIQSPKVFREEKDSLTQVIYSRAVFLWSFGRVSDKENLKLHFSEIPIH